MLRTCVTRCLGYVFLAPLALSAQALRDIAPLKYWPAPLYWQPTHEEIHPVVETGVAKTGLFSAAQSNLAPAQTPANSLVFVAITPCRLVDTRTGFGFTGAFGPPSLAGAGTRSFPIQASATCTVPSSAQAYSLNLTVVPPGPMGYLTIWPVGAAQPNASTLNDPLGTVVANAAIIPAGNDGSGSVNVFVSNSTELIIDINGYYAAQSGITLTQGSAATPSLSFAGDPGTGIYSSGAGILNVAAGGQPALSVGGSANNTAVGLNAYNPGSYGKNNTAIGQAALQHNTSGTANTAVGSFALSGNTDGASNTAVGDGALFANSIGESDTAVGGGAMQNNTTGLDNTAVGKSALFMNTGGHFNTAVGSAALYSNNGFENTATGVDALFSNTTGNSNTATGESALRNNTTGNQNTANGQGALANATTASDNTADGFNALQANTTGVDNTASGSGALGHNTTGVDNTAIGYNAMTANTTGFFSTAIGWNALQTNTTGFDNTAVGFEALQSNTTGSANTALGLQALEFNTTGGVNTATGYAALQDNTTGSNNTATGIYALATNTIGNYNTALGTQALNFSTGNNNVGIGYQSAYNVTTGSNNIHIGHFGSSGDNGVVRIGTPGTQTSFFVAGAYATAASGGIPLLVNSNGQLGTSSSSRRYKEDIQEMDDASSALLRLRPVTFRYKQPYPDGSKPLDYGLIAEEVAEIYPGLVVRNADGQIETVQYQKLTPMLLNELQKARREIEQQKADQQELRREMETRLAALEALLSAKP